jgi:catalase
MSAITTIAGPPVRTSEDQIVDFFKRGVALLQDKAKLPRVPRPVHVKHHGIVRATFVVGGDVEPALRHGMFAIPKTYQAYVRFSNSGSVLRDGDEPDVRGAAIKVIGVEGKKLLEDEQFTQDFVLVDHPVFMARDGADFMAFLEFRKRHKAGEVSDEEMNRKYPVFLPARRFVRNPLTTEYFSQTPYALGPELKVKYCLRPKQGTEEPLPPDEAKQKDPDYLRLAMVSTLQRDEVEFDFSVQCFVDEEATPIENPTKEWGLITAPPRKVATLVIPAQTFDSEKQQGFAREISFNPWHALEKHQPLGRLNEVRLDAYLKMLAHRREPNGKEQF